MKRNRASVGPVPVDIVPIRQFSEIRGGDLERAWELCGPSAEWNLKNGPLWTVIAAAYLEGLNHGFHGGRALLTP